MVISVFMKNTKGLTLVEVMITVAVVGIVAAVGTFSVSNVISSAHNQKLFSDVEAINRSIIAFRGAGGDLSKASNAEEVLTALKKSMSNGSRVPTLSGSKIDERVTLEFQDSAEASGSNWRAYWDASQFRFVLQKSGNTPGVKGFSIDPTAVSDATVDGNAKSAMLFAEKDTWIWDFEEVPVPVPSGPSSFAVGEVADSTTPPPGGGGGSTPPSATTPLSPPQFSIAGGSFPINSFNLPLTLTNPNPGGISLLYYSVDYGNWKPYSGPVSLSPGAIVAAQAISASALYSNSARVDQTYTAQPAGLLEPIISPDRNAFGLFLNRTIKVTITDRNSPSISKLQYRIGGDPWQDYVKTITLKRNNYPSGVMIQARALPIDPYYISSSTTLRTLGIEAASIAGSASGKFSNPVGQSEMVSNLGGGASNEYFEWGRDYWTAQELSYQSTVIPLSKNSLQYIGSNFGNVDADTRFQIGELSYFNGTVVNLTSADKVSFSVDLNLEVNGVTAKTDFAFDLDLINVLNVFNPNDLWADADYVKLANPVSSKVVNFNGVDFNLMLEFGETTADGIVYFNEFHVLEGKGATTKVYGTLVEVGSVDFNSSLP